MRLRTALCEIKMLWKFDDTQLFISTKDVLRIDQKQAIKCYSNSYNPFKALTVDSETIESNKARNNRRQKIEIYHKPA